MFKENGVCPADLIIQLDPCIKPPAYEVDFVKMITDDCLSCGVSENSLLLILVALQKMQIFSTPIEEKEVKLGGC